MRPLRAATISRLNSSIPQPNPPRHCRRITTQPDPPHHDLSSFLAHASRANLSPTSTLYIGTHYEYTVQRALVRLGLTLARTGGRLDKGIDLLGTWRLPGLPPPPADPLRVLVQCKALNRKAGPNLVRELEGAFAGAPAGWKALMARVGSGVAADEGRERSTAAAADGLDAAAKADAGAAGKGGIMALLVAPKEATKGVRDAMGRSRWPMGYAKVALDGRVEQMLWNRSAAARGFEGLGVTTRFRPRHVAADGEAGEPGESLEQELVLTWEGEVWEGGKDADLEAGGASGEVDSTAEGPRAASASAV